MACAVHVVAGAHSAGVMLPLPGPHTTNHPLSSETLTRLEVTVNGWSRQVAGVLAASPDQELDGEGDGRQQVQGVLEEIEFYRNQSQVPTYYISFDVYYVCINT